MAMRCVLQHSICSRSRPVVMAGLSSSSAPSGTCKKFIPRRRRFPSRVPLTVQQDCDDSVMTHFDCSTGAVAAASSAARATMSVMKVTLPGTDREVEIKLSVTARTDFVIYNAERNMAAYAAAEAQNTADGKTLENYLKAVNHGQVNFTAPASTSPSISSQGRNPTNTPQTTKTSDRPTPARFTPAPAAAAVGDLEPVFVEATAEGCHMVKAAALVEGTEDVLGPQASATMLWVAGLASHPIVLDGSEETEDVAGEDSKEKTGEMIKSHAITITRTDLLDAEPTASSEEQVALHHSMPSNAQEQSIQVQSFSGSESNPQDHHQADSTPHQPLDASNNILPLSIKLSASASDLKVVSSPEQGAVPVLALVPAANLCTAIILTRVEDVVDVQCAMGSAALAAVGCS